MSDATQKARQRRLRDAGYATVSGWVPAAYAARVKREVDKHREDVERTLRERPGKDPQAGISE